MKLSGAEAARFIDKPDPNLLGLLLYGGDPAEISARKTRLCRKLLGAGDESDMSLTRIAAADLRRDPALAVDALRARGFFGGRQVVTVEDAGDGHAEALKTALAGAVAGDAFLIVTAGVLPARSKLRKLFEDSKTAAAAGVYADAPGPDQIRRILQEAGAAGATGEALEAIRIVGAGSGVGAARELIERLALYRLDDGGEIEAEDVALCAGDAGEAEIDRLIDAALLGRSGEIGLLLRRLVGQGQSAHAIARALAWRLRQLHNVRTSSDAPDAAIGKLRPPVFGDRRATLLSAARKWRLNHVEGALQLSLLLDADLRRSHAGSDLPLVERCLMRLALTAERFRD